MAYTGRQSHYTAEFTVESDGTATFHLRVRGYWWQVLSPPGQPFIVATPDEVADLHRVLDAHIAPHPEAQAQGSDAP